MTVKELSAHFSDECMINIKLAKSDELVEDDLTLHHDWLNYFGTAYDNAEVAGWFYAKYEGECDELVVWIKDGYMQEE